MTNNLTDMIFDDNFYLDPINAISGLPQLNTIRVTTFKHTFTIGVVFVCIY